LAGRRTGWCSQSRVDVDEPVLVTVLCLETDDAALFERALGREDDVVAAHRGRAIRLRPERHLPALAASRRRQRVEPVAVACSLGDCVDGDVQPAASEYGRASASSSIKFDFPDGVGVRRARVDLSRVAGVLAGHRPRSFDLAEVAGWLRLRETAGEGGREPGTDAGEEGSSGGRGGCRDHRTALIPASWYESSG